MLRAVSASAAAGRRGLSAWSPAVQRLVGNAADGAGDFAGLLSIESHGGGTSSATTTSSSSAVLLIGPSHAMSAAAAAPASPMSVSRRMYSTSSPQLDDKKDGGPDAPVDPTKEVKQNAGSGLSNPAPSIPT